MGQAKALMMEMEDTDWELAEASFICPECKVLVCGSVDLPVVFETGYEVHLPVSVLCHICDEKYHGWVRTDWDCCDIELDDYSDVEIEVEPRRGYSYEYDDYDEGYYAWLEEQERRSRPVYQAFEKTIEDVRVLASGLETDQKSQMLARMLISQNITALEAYLADTLILTVSGSKEAQQRLLNSKDLKIGATQFKLVDAIGVEDFAKTKLLEHLRAVLFHNLNKVTGLYRVGLNVDITPDNENDLERIQKAIKMRHDCVHRNGVDRDTAEVHQISQTDLLDLAATLQRMVEQIEKKIEEIETPI